MKRLKEEKDLRQYISKQFAVVGYDAIEYNAATRLITALVKAMRKDCIEAYYDWCDRPTVHMSMSFPDALKKGMRWRKTKPIRAGR